MGEFMEAGGMGEELSRDQADAMLRFYCRTLNDLGYTPKPFKDLESKVGSSIYSAGKFEVMNHARWMCDRAEEFMHQNRTAKAYRWIGMIQGILFMGGVFTLAELRTHNRRGVG